MNYSNQNRLEFDPSRPSNRPTAAGPPPALVENWVRPVTAASNDHKSALAAGQLLVLDGAGHPRPATRDEVLGAAQKLLEPGLLGCDVFATPMAVKDYLTVKLGGLEYEMFAVFHLDSLHRVIDYVEMFRGTVTQTSVYPREILKDALARNATGIVMIHNHPSGSTQPSRADEHLTQRVKAALQLVDIRVIDHFIVAGTQVGSMATMGLM